MVCIQSSMDSVAPVCVVGLCTREDAIAEEARKEERKESKEGRR
jgi:hypothetical protein